MALVCSVDTNSARKEIWCIGAWKCHSGACIHDSGVLFFCWFRQKQVWFNKEDIWYIWISQMSLWWRCMTTWLWCTLLLLVQREIVQCSGVLLCCRWCRGKYYSSVLLCCWCNLLWCTPLLVLVLVQVYSFAGAGACTCVLLCWWCILLWCTPLLVLVLVCSCSGVGGAPGSFSRL